MLSKINISFININYNIKYSSIFLKKNEFIYAYTHNFFEKK